MKYKSQQERTTIPIRKTTLPVFKKKAKAKKLKQIDYIDELVLNG